MVVLNAFPFRFTIYKVHKASKKKREKSSAKKERKATKTLAIVLGKMVHTIHMYVWQILALNSFLLLLLLVHNFFPPPLHHYLPLFQFQFSHFKVTKKIGVLWLLYWFGWFLFFFLALFLSACVPSSHRHYDLCAESCTIHEKHILHFRAWCAQLYFDYKYSRAEHFEAHRIFYTWKVGCTAFCVQLLLRFFLSLLLFFVLYIVSLYVFFSLQISK